MSARIEDQMKGFIVDFVDQNEAETAIQEIDSMFQMAVTTEEFAEMEVLEKRNYVYGYKKVRKLLCDIATIEEEVSNV